MDEIEKIVSTPGDIILAENRAKRSALLAVRDGVFHEEQMRVWAEEIVAGLSPFLGIDSYEDGIEIQDQIIAVIAGSIRERVCEAITESRP